jgi:hypothetical protein
LGDALGDAAGDALKYELYPHARHCVSRFCLWHLISIREIQNKTANIQFNYMTAEQMNVFNMTTYNNHSNYNILQITLQQ